MGLQHLVETIAKGKDTMKRKVDKLMGPDGRRGNNEFRPSRDQGEPVNQLTRETEYLQDPTQKE